MVFDCIDSGSLASSLFSLNLYVSQELFALFYPKVCYSPVRVRFELVPWFAV